MKTNVIYFALALISSPALAASPDCGSAHPFILDFTADQLDAAKLAKNMRHVGYVTDQCDTFTIKAAPGVKFKLTAAADGDALTDDGATHKSDAIRYGDDLWEGNIPLCTVVSGEGSNEITVEMNVDQFDAMVGNGCSIDVNAPDATLGGSPVKGFKGWFWVAPDET